MSKRSPCLTRDRLPKQRFPNAFFARLAVINIQEEHRMRGRQIELSAYECTVCSQWHIGKPKRKDRKIQENNYRKVNGHG